MASLLSIIKLTVSLLHATLDTLTVDSSRLRWHHALEPHLDSARIHAVLDVDAVDPSNDPTQPLTL